MKSKGQIIGRIENMNDMKFFPDDMIYGSEEFRKGFIEALKWVLEGDGCQKICRGCGLNKEIVFTDEYGAMFCEECVKKADWDDESLKIAI